MKPMLRSWWYFPEMIKELKSLSLVFSSPVKKKLYQPDTFMAYLQKEPFYLRILSKEKK